jgi:hypothetical protein
MYGDKVCLEVGKYIIGAGDLIFTKEACSDARIDGEMMSNKPNDCVVITSDTPSEDEDVVLVQTKINLTTAGNSCANVFTGETYSCTGMKDADRKKVNVIGAFGSGKNNIYAPGHDDFDEYFYDKIGTDALAAVFIPIPQPYVSDIKNAEYESDLADVLFDILNDSLEEGDVVWDVPNAVNTAFWVVNGDTYEAAIVIIDAGSTNSSVNLISIQPEE